MKDQGTQDQIQRIYETIRHWLETVKKCDAEAISLLYAKQGVLLGTMAENVKQGRTVIKTYFDSFVLKEPVGSLRSIIFKVGGKYGWADGNYVFNLKDPKSPTGRTDVPARFTFIINLDDRLIETHHSSATPAGHHLGF